MKICGLELGEVTQLVSGRAKTLTQMNVLLNDYTVFHSLQNGLVRWIIEWPRNYKGLNEGSGS